MKTFMATIDDNNSSSSPSVTLTSNGSNKFNNARRSSIRSFESYDSVGSFASSYNIANTNPSSSSSSSLGDTTSSNANSTTLTGNHTTISNSKATTTTVSSHCLTEQDGISSTSSLGFISIRPDENIYGLCSRKSLEAINKGASETSPIRSPTKDSINRLSRLSSASNVGNRSAATLSRTIKSNQSPSSKYSPMHQDPSSHLQKQNSEKVSSTGLLNVAEMLLHGVADNEIIKTWLSSIGCEEYTDRFIESGYDMPTLSRMTPQDLTAIGITNPDQRNKIQTEIKKLNLQDGIPNFKPPDLEQWLKLLRLDDIYYNILCNQKYNSIEQVCQLTWEDFEEIGIKKLGHQKRFLLAIERIKEIESMSKIVTKAEPIYDTSPNQILLINSRTQQNLSKSQQHQQQKQLFQSNSNYYGVYDAQTLHNSSYHQPQSVGNLYTQYATMTRQTGKNPPPPVPVRTNSLRSTTSPLLSNQTNKCRNYLRYSRYKTQCVSLSANNHGTLNRLRQRYSIGHSDSNSCGSNGNIEAIYDPYSDDFYHSNDNDTNSDTNSIKSLLISSNIISPQQSASPSVISMNVYSNNILTQQQKLPVGNLCLQQNLESSVSLPTTDSYSYNNNHNNNKTNNNIIVSCSKGKDEDFPPPPSPLPPMDSDEDDQPSHLNDQFSMMSITTTALPPLPGSIPTYVGNDMMYPNIPTPELQQRLSSVTTLSYTQKLAPHQLAQCNNGKMDNDSAMNGQASAWATVSPFISPWPLPSN